MPVVVVMVVVMLVVMMMVVVVPVLVLRVPFRRNCIIFNKQTTQSYPMT